MAEQTPSVGRIVHYVSHGSPVRPDGTQAYTSECRAATVTEVSAETEGLVGLHVVNPTGQFFHSLADGGSPYDEWAGNDPLAHLAQPQGGSWHWPERV